MGKPNSKGGRTTPRKAKAYKDFDADTESVESEPLTFRKFGRMWELPGELPAGVVIMLSRLMAGGRGTDELAEYELIALGAELIPQDTLTKLQAKGLDVPGLADLLMWALGEYGAMEAADEGKA